MKADKQNKELKQQLENIYNLLICHQSSYQYQLDEGKIDDYGRGILDEANTVIHYIEKLLQN